MKKYLPTYEAGKPYGGSHGTARWRIIKSAAGNGAAVWCEVRIMLVSEDRIGQARREGLTRTFTSWPAVISAAYAFIDFLPRGGAHIVDEHPSRAGLKVKCKRISHPEYIDRLIFARRAVVEWIISRKS